MFIDREGWPVHLRAATSDTSVEPRPMGDAFVNTTHLPADAAAKEYILSLAASLGLEKVTDAEIRCLSGVRLAAQQARKKSGLICFSGNANDYAGGPVGYRKAAPIRRRLIDLGVLRVAFGPFRGRSTLFIAELPDEVEYRFAKLAAKRQSFVRVREPKPDSRPKSKGRLLRKREKIDRFGSAYLEEEARIRRLNEALSEHPLELPCGATTSHMVTRVFNEGRMDRGGRLYGDYMKMPKADRLACKIDGSAVCEIDVKACALFLALAMSGEEVPSGDPYATIPIVAKDPGKRDLVKLLVAAILSRGGPLNRFPKDCRDDFNLGRNDRLQDYQKSIFTAFPFLRNLKVSGLEVPFLESCIFIRTIEALLDRGVRVLPMHDCIICKEDDYETVASELCRLMLCELGTLPAMSVSFSDGREITLDQRDLTKIMRGSN